MAIVSLTTAVPYLGIYLFHVECAVRANGPLPTRCIPNLALPNNQALDFWAIVQRSIRVEESDVTEAMNHL